MPSRRDVLKTVVLGTGSVYLSSLLGCGESKTRKVSPAVNAKTPPQSPFYRHSQNYTIPHHYLRDGTPLPAGDGKTLKCDVAIVGSGPSGLSAAYALRKQGLHVIILENEERAGGAAVFSSYRGLRFPLASIYFVDQTPLVQELLDFSQTNPVAAPEDALVLNTHYYYDYWQDSVIGSMEISATDREAMKRFRDDILAVREVPPYPLPSRLNTHLAALDRMTAREYCDRYRSPFLNNFIELYTRSSMGTTLDLTNAYGLINFYTGEIAKDASVKRLSFDGGLGGFTERLSERFNNEELLLSHCVTRIEQNNNGVLLHAVHADREVRVQADHVVVATQKFMVPRLIPDLPDDQRKAIASFHYTPMLTVHLCSEQPIMPNRGFDTWFPEAGELFTDIIDPKTIGARVDGEAYVASVYVPLPETKRSLLLDEPSVVDYARAVATKTLELMGQPNSETVREVYTYAWGHSMVQARPGSHNGPAQRASRPFGSIFFANTDNTSISAFENGVAEGFRAAELVLKHRRVAGSKQR